MLSIVFFFTFTLSRKPVFLASGFNGSPLYGTVIDPKLADPDCPSDMKDQLFFDPQNPSSTSAFYSAHPKCQALLMQVYLDKSTGKVSSPPGLKVESSPLGDTTKLLSYDKLISTLQNEYGYKLNDDLFGVGYNFMSHPLLSDDKYEEMKLKIEGLYAKNGEKSILIGHSQGTGFVSIFVSNYTTEEWAKKYIDSVIFLAPAFGGMPSFGRLWNQKFDPYPNTAEMKKTVSRMPGQLTLLPNYEIYGNITVVYNIDKTNYKNGNATRVIDFLEQYNRYTKEDREYYGLVEKYLKVAVPEPPVPSLIIYNDAIMLPNGYVCIPVNRVLDSPKKVPGDGTVTSHGAEYACGKWKSAQCFNLHSTNNNANHLGMCSNEKTLNLITEFIHKDKSVKVAPKKGLFLASGFQGSPIYATVYDANKIPECDPNMQFFPFFPIDKNKGLVEEGKYPSENCLAKLTRVEMDPSGTHTNYADGVYIQSSRFGEYHDLLSYTSIIAEAFRQNYTLFKDVFGVGYNFMLHPLMSNDIYNELKINIEKYYSETGMKSIIGGHSQGTSFVEIFITDYVTKEWAQKYVDGVIFYAPAFSGWGTYGRSVDGNYGSGFPGPDNSEMLTSVMRMPGCHIMMPNEGVFGSKTMIKDFPKKGDLSNASMTAPLLKKLGRMDDAAYEVFKLTDKYRKPPLPEPPVDSLIIYNGFRDTKNGYVYNEATNTVGTFFGKGDGTVSDDGPIYACEHWKNVTCYNFNINSVDHSNIQTNQKTIDLTFEFINKKRGPEPVPPTTTITSSATTTSSSSAITTSSSSTDVKPTTSSEVEVTSTNTNTTASNDEDDSADEKEKDSNKGLSDNVIITIAVIVAVFIIVATVIIMTCVVKRSIRKERSTTTRSLYSEG